MCKFVCVHECGACVCMCMHMCVSVHMCTKKSDVLFSHFSIYRLTTSFEVKIMQKIIDYKFIYDSLSNWYNR